MNYLEFAFAVYCVGLLASVCVVEVAIAEKTRRVNAFACAFLWPIVVVLVLVGTAVAFVMAYARRER